MDFTHDWRTLNEVLFCQNGLAKHSPTCVALGDGQKIIDAVLSTGEPFVDQFAELDKLETLGSKYRMEQTVSLSKRDFDQVAADAAAMGTNYFQQLEFVRSKVFKQVNNTGEIRISREHFVLRFFSGRASALLPRRFNVLVFLDQRSSLSSMLLAFEYRAILLSFDKGKLDQFFEPDFSSLHEERLPGWLSDPMAIGKYLESRYILPCYGLFMLQSDWNQCVAHPDPWSVFRQALDGGRAALYPRGILSRSLLAFQKVRSYIGKNRC